MLLSLVGVHAFCNERTKALALLDSVERRPDARVSGVFIAALFMSMQKRDSALAWLGRTEWGTQGRYQLRIMPVFAPLRSDRRFVKMLADMGSN
jgi:hypothetical protein